MKRRDINRKKAWKRKCRRAALGAFITGAAFLAPLGLDDDTGVAVAVDLYIQGGGGGGGGGSSGPVSSSSSWRRSTTLPGTGGSGYIQYGETRYLGGGSGYTVGGMSNIPGGSGGRAGDFEPGEGPTEAVEDSPGQIGGLLIEVEKGGSSYDFNGGAGGDASFQAETYSTTGEIRVISGGDGENDAYSGGNGGKGGAATFTVGTVRAMGNGTQEFEFTKDGGDLTVNIGHLILENNVTITLTETTATEVQLEALTFTDANALNVTSRDNSSLSSKGALTVTGYDNSYTTTNTTASHDASGENLTFILNGFRDGQTMLSANSAIDVKDATVTLGLAGDVSNAAVGQSVILLKNVKNSIANDDAVETVSYGLVDSTFTINQETNQETNVIRARYNSKQLGANAPAVLEGGPLARWAALGSLLGNISGFFDTFQCPGWDNTPKAARANECVSPGGGMDNGFFVMPRYDRVKLDTLGDLRYDGFSLLAGFGLGRDTGLGRLSLAAVFTAGWGDYDADGVYDGRRARVKGDVDYYGGALLARLRLNDNLGLEASFLAGRVGSDFRSRDFGAHMKYDSTTPYFGGHVGAFYLIPVGRLATFEPYAKLFVMHQDADSLRNNLNQSVHFDAFTSVSTRVGARYWQALSDTVQAFAGASWEYEFKAAAKGSALGRRLRSTDLQGHSAHAELGLRLRPSCAWEIDLSVNGSAGKRAAIGTTFSVMRRF